MPARDIFHNAVRSALEKDEWVITHAPLSIKIDEIKFYICIMEKMNYQELVQTILKGHSKNHLDNDTEVQLLFDTEGDHYQVVHLGWEEQRRVYGCVIHVDIKDGKIWIQRDRTEVGVANELVAAGVPKKDIVLGFQSPYKRQFTEYAVS